MLGIFGTTFVLEFFRQKFRMTTLKSGFKKAYISGFTSELVATVKGEIVSKTTGIRSGRFKTRQTAVEYNMGNQESKNDVETMQKTFATFGALV